MMYAYFMNFSKLKINTILILYLPSSVDIHNIMRIQSNFQAYNIFCLYTNHIKEYSIDIIECWFSML